MKIWCEECEGKGGHGEKYGGLKNTLPSQCGYCDGLGYTEKKGVVLNQQSLEQVLGESLIGWWLDDSDPNSPVTANLDFTNGKEINIYVNDDVGVIVEGD